MIVAGNWDTLVPVERPAGAGRLYIGGAVKCNHSYSFDPTVGIIRRIEAGVAFVAVLGQTGPYRGGTFDYALGEIRSICPKTFLKEKKRHDDDDEYVVDEAEGWENRWGKYNPLFNHVGGKLELVMHSPNSGDVLVTDAETASDEGDYIPGLDFYEFVAPIRVSL